LISGFANIAKRLIELREQKQSFQWTEEVDAAFPTLKVGMCPVPILANSRVRREVHRGHRSK
jgi:hypothetical protein